MNKKFKRALSSILTFIMAFSCLTVMNVSSVLADETVTYDLTASPFGSGNYSGVSSEDGNLTIYASSYNGVQHGMTFGSGTYFTLTVDGNTTITFTACQFNNGSSFTVTDTEGSISNSITTTGTGNSGTYTCGDVISYTYEGNATTLTFTSAGTNYVTEITATPVSDDSGSQTYTDDATYDLRSLGSSDVTSYTSDDGCFTLSASSFNGTQHGCAFTNGSTFTVAVKPNTTIAVGQCKYTSSDTTFTVTESAGGETLSTDFSNYNSDNCDTTTSYSYYTTIDYTGSENTVITFTASGTAYVPYVIVSAAASEQTYTSSATYDLRSSIGTASDDGCFTISASYHDSQHGYLFSKGNTFTVAVEPNTTIAVGNCSYTSSTFTVTESTGGTTLSDSFSNYGTCDSTTSYTNYLTVNYTGTENTVITFTANGSAYVPYVIVSEYVPGNSNVKITVSGTDDGDVLLLKENASDVSYAYSVSISNETADLTGTKLSLQTYYLEANGYTLSADSITITEDTDEYTVTAAATATEEVSNTGADIYVGYKETDGYSVYNTVQAAVNNADSGTTIQLAPNTSFNERVLVTTSNITIEGSGTDSSIITFNDSEANNDTYFHGATVAVLAEGFTASNLTIKNTSDGDGTATNSEGTTKNGTALSVGYADNITASAELNNCVIWATRDTIYTGKASSTSNTTYNSCTIYGFQDVICGAGDVTLNDCTWDVNSAYNARLFAPQGGSTNIANNLTVTNSAGSSYTKSTFARAWGQTGLEPDCVVVINGYTDNDSNIYANGAAISDNNPSVYGFETAFVGTSTGDITEMMWLVRKTENTGNYNTTYAAFNSTSANELKSSEYDSDQSAYRIVGTMNSDFINESNISEIGFAVYNGDTLIGNVSSDTVYLLDGDTETTYYTVVFMENGSSYDSVTVMPYIEYNGYDVEGNASQTITFSAE